VKIRKVAGNGGVEEPRSTSHEFSIITVLTDLHDAGDPLEIIRAGVRSEAPAWLQNQRWPLV